MSAVGISYGGWVRKKVSTKGGVALELSATEIHGRIVLALHHVFVPPNAPLTWSLHCSLSMKFFSFLSHSNVPLHNLWQGPGRACLYSCYPPHPTYEFFLSDAPQSYTSNVKLLQNIFLHINTHIFSQTISARHFFISYSMQPGDSTSTS